MRATEPRKYTNRSVKEKRQTARRVGKTLSLSMCWQQEVKFLLESQADNELRLCDDQLIRSRQASMHLGQQAKAACKSARQAGL